MKKLISTKTETWKKKLFGEFGTPLIGNKMNRPRGVTGVGLTDSPVGLAAYILEKFSMGTDLKSKYHDDGRLLQVFSADELIDNLMYYWVPNKATSAMRLYAESFNKRELSYRMDRWVHSSC